MLHQKGLDTLYTIKKMNENNLNDYKEFISGAENIEYLNSLLEILKGTELNGSRLRNVRLE